MPVPLHDVFRCEGLQAHCLVGAGVEKFELRQVLKRLHDRYFADDPIHSGLALSHPWGCACHSHCTRAGCGRKLMHSRTRKAYAARDATPHSQALTKEPLEAVSSCPCLGRRGSTWQPFRLEASVEGSREPRAERETRPGCAGTYRPPPSQNSNQAGPGDPNWLYSSRPPAPSPRLSARRRPFPPRRVCARRAGSERR